MPFSTELMNFVLALIVVIAVAWIVDTRALIERRIKTLVNLVLGLIVIGILLWMINTYIPMAKSIKAILNIVVVAATCIGVLQTVGWWAPVVGIWNNWTRSFHSTPHDGPHIVT
ncbi:MAG TPA: Thivi_2564 family membrane protein [Bryobacteraceae bacterium]|jgi:predicted membrane protein